MGRAEKEYSRSEHQEISDRKENIVLFGKGFIFIQIF